MLDPSQTVAQIVLDHSSCAPVFQRHRIDYCCKGKQSLADACSERGLEVPTVLGELEQAIASRAGSGGFDPRTASTTALIGHIVATHHEYLRSAIPFLRPLANKVARVHGDSEPRLRELRDTVTELFDALEPHLELEEQQVFPAMMAKADPAAIAAGVVTLDTEHLEVGAMLHKMRDLTDDFTPPEWACNSYRTLFSELHQLEGDTLRHVHLETHVLKPRFVAS